MQFQDYVQIFCLSDNWLNTQLDWNRAFTQHGVSIYFSNGHRIWHKIQYELSNQMQIIRPM